MKRLFLIVLSLFSFGLANAQTVSNVRSTFSCPGKMTINYDLYMMSNESTTNVTVSYSTDNGQNYYPCTTVSGNLSNQTTGAGKTIIWDLAADGFSTGFFVFKVEAETCANGVMINGVCWATRNVDKPGTFAENPEDAGMFYQWNRKIGWSATDPMINSNNGTVWDNTIPTGTTWEKVNDPSPAGWRVPTLEELQKLLDTNKVAFAWVTQNGVPCIKFTDRVTGNTLFLPIAGFRDYNDGMLSTVLYSNYWSSTQYESSKVYTLVVTGWSIGIGVAGGEGSSTSDGFFVRSVAE